MTYAAAPLDVHVTGRRVVATLLDGLVFGVLSSVLHALFGTNTGPSGFDIATLSTGGSTLLFVVGALYYVFMEGLLGRTLGKMVTGIRVIDEVTGNPPGLGKAVLRTLLRLIDGIFAYLVALVVALNSDRRRRLGDMVAKTLVVRA